MIDDKYMIFICIINIELIHTLYFLIQSIVDKYKIFCLNGPLA